MTWFVRSTYFSIIMLLSSWPLAPAAPSAEAAPTTAGQPPLPNLTLLPWAIIGFNSEEKTAFKVATSDSQQQIIQQYFAKSSSLSDYLRAYNIALPLNAHNYADTIVVGSPKAQSSGALAIQPIACPLRNEVIISFEISDNLTGIILGASSGIIKKSSLMTRDFLDPTVMTSRIKAIGNAQMRAAWQAITVGQSPSTLTLGLALASDNESHLCLNMLLGQSLAKTYKTQRAIGNNEIYHLQQLLGIDPSLKRANRMLVAIWEPAEGDALPIKGALALRLSESVFAHNIPPAIKMPFVIERADPLVMPITAPLVAFLKQENSALSLLDKPQIAKIHRAWVYLDKGRAYGLRMGDRLYFEQGGTLIKGHVVRYFGPELGIVSPRGYPVNEGAIVFIRKGQRLTKVGQELDYDPTSFPTPWPPIKQPATGH